MQTGPSVVAKLEYEKRHEGRVHRPWVHIRECPSPDSFKERLNLCRIE